MANDWSELSGRKESKKFTCGYCSEKVSSVKGYTRYSPKGDIYICTDCENPNFFDYTNKQYPGPKIGRNIKDGLSKEVKDLYDEARNSFSVSAFTGCVMCLRKILMNIAVSLGDKPGKNYIDYIDYLYDNHHIPVNSKEWVDKIRKIGNEANHEIKSSTVQEAECLLLFVETILEVIFENTHKAKQLLTTP